MTWPRRKARSAARRGYGHAHKQLRAAIAPHVPGTPCSRCGYPIREGQEWELDHNDNRDGYLGPSHKSCNRRAASKKARAQQLRPQPRPLTQW